MQYSANLSLVGYSMYSSSICNTTNFNCTAYYNYMLWNKIAHSIGVTFGYCILHTYRTMLGYTTHAGDDTHVCDTLCLPAWWGLTMYDHHVNDALLGDLRIIHRCLEVPDICHFWQKVLILQTKSCDKKKQLRAHSGHSGNTPGPECSVPGVLLESLGRLWEHSEKIQRTFRDHWLHCTRGVHPHPEMY